MTTAKRWRGQQVLFGGYEVEPGSGRYGELVLALELCTQGNRTVRVHGHLSGIGHHEEEVTGSATWTCFPAGVAYDLKFTGHRLRAKIRIDWRNPVFSASRIVGTIASDDGESYRVELRWDLRHRVLDSLWSWRRDQDPGILRGEEMSA